MTTVYRPNKHGFMECSVGPDGKETPIRQVAEMPQEPKPKRKRRTRAEMEAARAAEQANGEPALEGADVE